MAILKLGLRRRILDGYEALCGLWWQIRAQTEIQFAGLACVMGFPLVEALLHCKAVGWQVSGFNNVRNQYSH